MSPNEASPITHAERVERSVEGYLNNFDFQYSGCPIDLAPDVALFEVPREEIKRRECSEMARHAGDALAAWKMLVSARGQSLAEVEEKVQRRFRDVLTAFRLLKSGGIEIRAFHYHPWGPTMDESDITNEFITVKPLGVCKEGAYRLVVEDVARVKLLLSQVAETADGRVQRALHRFNVAYLDYRLDDKLIDNVIALEALLLPESQELGLRLAMRSACLLAEEGNREAVFEFVRRAYNYRSDFVHGGEPNLPKDVECSHKKYSAHEFVMTLQNLEPVS